MMLKWPDLLNRSAVRIRQGGVLFGLLAATAALAADPRVVVFAKAEPDYLEARRLPDGQLREETYFVVKGTFFPGQVRDRTLENTTIHDVARMLSPELRKQSYVPARSVESADLMLVVHWGTTVRAKSDSEYFLDAQRQQRDALDLRAELRAFQSDGSDTPPNVHPNWASNPEPHAKTGADHVFDGLMNDLYWGPGSASIVAGDRITEDVIGSSMASLLGFSEALHAEAKTPFGTPQGRSLRSMLNDSRYFVVVMAYDFQALQASGFKQTRRLWSCRLSMHSPGVNFRQAVQRIGTIGANYFGTHTPEIAIQRAKPGETVIEIGEATVVDW